MTDGNYIFQQLVRRGKVEGITDAIRQRDTRSWFRAAAKSIQNVDKNRMLNDKENTFKMIDTKSIGSMVMFSYDPKNKTTLPYYDTFPLIFVVGLTKGGFQGINLHYLPPVLRARLMDKLYSISNDRKYNDNTKLNISYQLLKSTSKFKYFQPCFKMYLWGHVGSNFLKIQPKMWDAALMLPTARFMKSTTDKIWKESQEMVR